MGRQKGLQPNLWKHPYDPVKRAKALAWVRAKAQAKFRGEEWAITEEEWMNSVWPDSLWARRGRKSMDLCLIRDDARGSWHIDNIIMVTRRTQLAFQKGMPEMKEVEPNIWDITGSTLERWSRNQVTAAKYR